MMCKFCDPKIGEDFYIGETHLPYISLTLENSYGQITIRAIGSNHEAYYPKYCPECGRKLTDEDT